MKKIELEKIEYFRSKDLKKYSKKVNLYFKRKFRFVFVVILVSCSAQSPIESENYEKFPENFSAHFYDKLDTLQPVSSCDQRIYTRSFLKNFTQNETVNYQVPLEIKIRNEKIFLRFEDIFHNYHVIQFYGKKYKDKYVFYTNYKTISFPVLFTTKEMTKYICSLQNNNEFVVKEYSVNEANLFFLGAGNAYNQVYRFKILNHE